MKNKTTFLVIILIAALIGAAYYKGIFKSMMQYGSTASSTAPVVKTGTITKQLPPTPVAFDAKNGTYNVDDMTVTLVNGSVDTPVAPGSAEEVTTQYFGNEAVGDLNGDGIPDSAFLLTQYGAGTGIFYYAVAVLKTTTKATVTNSVFIGDRIAPQTTEIKDGHVIVNYADRKEGQAMTDEPTVGVSKYLEVTSKGELIESNK